MNEETAGTQITSWVLAGLLVLGCCFYYVPSIKKKRLPVSDARRTAIILRAVTGIIQVLLAFGLAPALYVYTSIGVMLDIALEITAVFLTALAKQDKDVKVYIAFIIVSVILQCHSCE